ncbi:MazG family protein [Agromyces mediolanus]|uniref:MazG family protein n=1 Tax=Agromyces mediolanus TaxID=41986 RepID=UPI001E655947|nr:MazG family protein [Agromyces mediolanus]MCD1572793.1 MazG family protein [Agromyces mediolanus]
MTAAAHPALDELIATVALLRAPGGCPWDAEQTHASLVQYLVEECWELIDAIESGDRAEMIEELGDVLYQVLFHADLAAHTPGEDFDLEDVARHMTAKMVARHPHVFGDREAETAEDVVGFWDELKADEKPHRTSVLDGVPMGMPALALAAKVLTKAEKAGVAPSPRADGPRVTLSGAPLPGDSFPADEAELGEALLRLVAEARDRGLDAERALRGAVRDFSAEVRAAEASAQREPR